MKTTYKYGNERNELKNNKIILCSVNSRYIHSSLAIHYLAARINNDAELIEWTINKSEKELSEIILKSKPDVVGFSCYIWNIEFILNVISLIRLNSKNITIVLGGPQVGFTPEKYLTSEIADYVVSGEGEEPFKRLVEKLNVSKCNDIGKIDGVSTVKHTSIPYYDDSIPPNPYNKTYLDMLQGKISYIETVRGCPFGCSFCVSGRKEPIKYIPMDMVKRNIEFLAQSGTKTIKFVDRSFNANEKRAIEIIKYILYNYEKYPQGIQFHFEIAADILSEEIVSIFCSAPKGLFRLEIGIQSLNEKTLKSINRRMNVSRLKKNIESLTENNNLHIHLDLIVGLPFEGLESLEKSFNEVMKLKPNVMQLGFLKLLPGSPMYEQPLGEFKKTPPYEVIQTLWITNDEINRAKKIEHLLDKIYNSGRFNKVLSILKEFNDNPFKFFDSFATCSEIIEGESYFELAEKLLKYLKDSNNIEDLYSSMRIDVKKVNPVGRLPNFLKL